MVGPEEFDKRKEIEQIDIQEYLEPAGEINYITPYQIFIDRAKLPKDKIGESDLITPELLFIRLNYALQEIKGVSLILSKPQLPLKITELSDEMDLSQYPRGTIECSLTQYPNPVNVSIEFVNYEKSEIKPLGVTAVWMRASYTGKPGLKIRELEEIALKHNLSKSF